MAELLPPSAKLNAEAESTTSEYARQGTDCHELCAYLVEKALGKDVKDPTENLDYYDSEMQQCAEEYRKFVLEQIEKAKSFCPDPLVFIEHRLDFSRWVEKGFGTGDCVIVADEELQIIDYKHGLGILVDADHNSQMMCYALCAIEIFDGIYDIEKIQMTIFQPRRDNISTCTLTKEELLNWAETVLKPTAELAYNREGEFKTAKWCGNRSHLILVVLQVLLSLSFSELLQIFLYSPSFSPQVARAIFQHWIIIHYSLCTLHLGFCGNIFLVLAVYFFLRSSQSSIFQ